VRGRPLSGLFFLVCAVGSATALGLAVHEARSTDAVVADVRSTVRSGLATRAVVDVRNTTQAHQCAAIRVVARDRTGSDLATAPATRVELAPGARATTTATLQLTAKDYAERLTLVRAVVGRCG
jgi:hypothetical protein